MRTCRKTDFGKLKITFISMTYHNRKSSENFGNGSKVIFRCFYDFLKFSENFRKCSEIFGKLRKRSNVSKVIFRCFYDFLKFSENFRKSSEVFRNLPKIPENFGNGSKVVFHRFYDFLKSFKI